MIDYIGIKDCIKGGIYRIRSRNLDVGAYDGNEGFIGIRDKFGSRYLFTEYHFDQGAPFGTVFPLEHLGDVPVDIALVEGDYMLDHYQQNDDLFRLLEGYE